MSDLRPRPASSDWDDLSRILPEGILAAIRTLCERYNVSTLDVFGSATTGRFDEERSDIDLVVEFPPFPEPAGRANAFFALHEALEGLLLRRVDLITEMSIKNPILRQSIDRSRQRVFPHAAF